METLCVLVLCSRDYIECDTMSSQFQKIVYRDGPFIIVEDDDKWIEVPKVKKFSKVKTVKEMSRDRLPVPVARVIQNKRKKKPKYNRIEEE